MVTVSANYVPWLSDSRRQARLATRSCRHSLMLESSFAINGRGKRRLLNRDPQIGVRRVPGQSPGRCNFARPAKPSVAVNRRLAGTRAESTSGFAMWPSCPPILISEISDRVTLARSAMNRRRKAAAWSVIQFYKSEVGKRDQRHQK